MFSYSLDVIYTVLFFVKPHWLKVDFNKWKDEDDSDMEEEKDMAFEDVS